MTYEYTKTGVDVEALGFEINKSTVIVKVLTSITFKEPNELKTNFDSALTSAEETELNTIITNHTGVALKHYRLYCNTDGDYRSIKLDISPTECPSCQGVDINDIVEQTPYTLVKDELENNWEKFMASDGSIIISRRF